MDVEETLLNNLSEVLGDCEEDFLRAHHLKWEENFSLFDSPEILMSDLIVVADEDFHSVHVR